MDLPTLSLSLLEGVVAGVEEHLLELVPVPIGDRCGVDDGDEIRVVAPGARVADVGGACPQLSVVGDHELVVHDRFAAPDLFARRVCGQ